ncbi:MAG: hypothetical protein ABI024_09370, partial [Vicinamibacterales bacterium]
MKHQAFLIAAILIGLLLGIPSPESHVIDPDHGQQLAGAQQIAAGEHPFIDFRSTYGPLSYYPSAVAQILSSDRIAAELALGILGYLAAYLCLFAAVQCLTGRPWIAYVCTAVAVLLAPSTYKYYIAAGPLVVLLASHRYLEKPGKIRLALLALSVAATGLFRPDYGAYTALTACAAIWLSEPGGRRWQTLSVWAALVVMFASPWLLFLAAKGGLGEYLYSSTWESMVQARSLTLPLPQPDLLRLFSMSNARFVSLVYFWTLPVACAAIVWRTRRSAAIVGDWRMVIVTVILAQLTLLQSVHRSDHRHLVEAIPASLVLVAWLTAMATSAVRAGDRRVRLAGAAGLAATVIAMGAVSSAAIELHDVEVASPLSVLRWSVEYSGTRSALVEGVRRRDPENWQAAAIQYIRQCTAPDERVLALPLLTSYYHLAGRRFAGGHMYISPGFFNDEADQRRFIAILKSQRVPVIIDIPGQRIDGRDDRRIRRMAPIV